MPIRVTHIITGLGVGGAEMMLSKLQQHSDPTAFSHSIISLMDLGALGPQLLERGVDVQVVDLKRGRPSLRGARRLLRIVEDQRPDVVQCWMYHADLAGALVKLRFPRLPVAWGIRHSDLDPEHSSKLTILIARACAAVSHRLPDRIVCCSEASARTHAAMGYAADKMQVIPNGFDISRFRPDPEARTAVRAELELPASTTLVGIVGRFNAQKDHRTFIRAAGHLKRSLGDVRFVLCGRGCEPGNEALATWLAENDVGDRCHLLGQRSDVPRLMASFDLLVSSSSFGEGFPNVLGEAMACGVPCVATDVGDSALIVGETGRIVAHSDPAALAKAIAAVLGLEAEDRHSLGQAALRRIQENFDIHDVTKRYEAVYRELGGRL